MKPMKTSLNGILGKAAVSPAVLGGCLLLASFFHFNKVAFIDSFAPCPTPWAAIGGCGASERKRHQRYAIEMDRQRSNRVSY